MRVLNIIGRPGAGKTSLIKPVLSLLHASGLDVSVIIYRPDATELDQPGKDSHRHRRAGAREVLVSSSQRWALLKDETAPDPMPQPLLGRLAPSDLVLTVGFANGGYPSLEVWRQDLNQPPMWPETPGVLAVASDAFPDIGDRALLPLNQPEIVATWIKANAVARDLPGS